MNKNDKKILILAPKFKALTEDILYGDIWERASLTKRERSIATLAALISSARFEQLSHHINLAKNYGINDDELIELFTHLAFYAGWPSTVSAIACLQDIKALDDENQQSGEKL